jgi:hypothetical protein
MQTVVIWLLFAFAAVYIDGNNFSLLESPRTLIEHFDWHRFLHGDIQRPVTLGRLSKELVTVLGATDDRIYLHPSYAPKFLMKHFLTANHLELLPTCIEKGIVLQDRVGTLQFLFRDTAFSGDIFHAAIKVTGERHEIWVTTFFRIAETELRRRLKRSEFIRAQK